MSESKLLGTITLAFILTICTISIYSMMIISVGNKRNTEYKKMRSIEYLVEYKYGEDVTITDLDYHKEFYDFGSFMYEPRVVPAHYTFYGVLNSGMYNGRSFQGECNPDLSNLISLDLEMLTPEII